MGAFQKRFSALLAAHGWRQQEAASHLGISQSLVSHYLRGTREPTLMLAAQIAGRLGVSVDELTGAARLPVTIAEAPAAYGRRGTRPAGQSSAPMVDQERELERECAEWMEALRVRYLRSPKDAESIRTMIRICFPEAKQARILAFLTQK